MDNSSSMLADFIMSSRYNYIYPQGTLPSNLFFRKTGKNPYWLANDVENIKVSLSQKSSISEEKENFAEVDKAEAEKIILISNERYINKEATKYLKENSAIKYYYYDDTYQHEYDLVEFVNKNNNSKKYVLMINSSSIFNSEILGKFPHCTFIAPYSTLKKLRDYKNCLFFHGTDDYLLKSKSFLGQIISSGSKYVSIITSKPSGNNPEIRKSLNTIIESNLNSRPNAFKFKYFFIEDLNTSNFDSELNSDPTGESAVASSRRIYYVGDGKGATKLIDIVTKVYEPSKPVNFILLAFLNYFNLPIESIKKLSNQPNFANVQFSTIYAGKSLYGNSYLENASELAKLLKEDFSESMTPATSVLPAILFSDNWDVLVKTGIVYKGIDTNFIRLGNILQNSVSNHE